MKNHNLFTAVLILFIISCFSITAQESVSSSGKDIKGNAGSVSYSVGQVVYTKIADDDNSMIQGVQQPYEISEIVSSVDIELALADVNLYPNPSSGVINISVKNIELSGLTCYLFDIKGNQILEKQLSNNETQIQMNELPAGTYLIKIKQSRNLIATYKIIKH